jgi:hypothetical protein
MKPRKSCPSFLAFFCLALGAYAQPATVTGQITESLHGKPLPKVKITLRGPADATSTADLYSASSDSAGRFQIAKVPAGSYFAAFSRTGFVGPLGRDGSLESPPPVVLHAGEQRTLDAQLTPAGVVWGRTLDGDGDPVRYVTVALVEWSAADKREIARGLASSDDRGEYRIYDVVPGVYYLRAVAPYPPPGASFQVPTEQIRGPRPPQGFLPTYYPSARERTFGTPLKVSAGEELARLDLHLLPAMLYTVRLKVLTRRPLGGSFEFLLESRSGDGKVQRAIGDPPEFQSVLPGAYRLTGILHRQARIEPEGYARLDVEVVDRDLDLVAPPFVAGLEIAGKVQADGPVPFPLERLRLELVRDTPDLSVPKPIAMAAADGSFLFRGVMPDLYTLLVTPPTGAYVKSVKLGNRELPDQHLDLSAGAAPLTVQLATDGGRIAGGVETAAGEASTRTPVMLIPDGPQRDRQDRIRSTATDESGHFTLEDIAPGEYRLYAWDGAHLRAAQDADFRRRYQSQSIPITVKARAAETVSLTTITAR